MSIELTEQQQDELAVPSGTLSQVINRRTNAVYVLVPLEEYEAIREMLEDEREQRAIHAVAARNSLRRAEDRKNQEQI